MSLLPRRARARETTAPVLPPEQAARLQAQIDDPDVGFLRRRALHRQLLGIRAIGPSGPPAPEPAPDAAPGGDALAMPPGGSDAHYTAVVAEVHALDRHAAEIDARLAALANSDSVEAHELRAERQQITMLRAELLGDLARGPVGTEHQRRIIAMRSDELRRHAWADAERAAAAGDHRHARRRRLDALRARMRAEDEAGLRKLSGYL